MVGINDTRTANVGRRVRDGPTGTQDHLGRPQELALAWLGPLIGIGLIAALRQDS